MSMPLKWEFPGGKIKPDESPEQCLCRELAEELDIRIAIKQPLAPTTHEYPVVTVTLYPFICSIVGGEIRLNEHAAITWLPSGALFALDWAEADLPVLAAYCRQLEKSR
jgi:8-oxo-dGTP diphosphatase